MFMFHKKSAKIMLIKHVSLKKLKLYDKNGKTEKGSVFFVVGRKDVSYI